VVSTACDRSDPRSANAAAIWRTVALAGDKAFKLRSGSTSEYGR
jgi:hypothetical protein